MSILERVLRRKSDDAGGELEPPPYNPFAETTDPLSGAIEVAIAPPELPRVEPVVTTEPSGDWVVRRAEATATATATRTKETGTKMTRELVVQKVRRGERLERADLRGAELAQAMLAGAALSRADLESANLEGAKLIKAALKHACLREARANEVDLSGANLEGADLEGAQLERANLAGANLTRANLEGANLAGADLTGAVLSFAQAAAANLTGAKLREAILIHVDLDEACLGGVTGAKADFSSATLRRATLDGADLTGAVFADATLVEARARNTRLTGACLHKADLREVSFDRVDLSGCDIRQAQWTGARLSGVSMTGAKLAGITGTGLPPEGLRAEWVDISPAGDGTGRIQNGLIPGIVSGLGKERGAEPRSPGRRYFGRGDAIKDARLSFGAGATVEIDSFFQNCVIEIGEDTDLVVGPEGLLADCTITGAGRITVHGQFFEGEAPGIVGPRHFEVSERGKVVARVEQSPDGTRFAFQRGCCLRLNVVNPKSGQNGHTPKGAEE